MVGKIDGQTTTLVVQHFGKSFIAPQPAEFVRPSGELAPEVAGTTQVSTGKAIEVLFKEANHRSLAGKIVFYAQKFFLILLIFIGINLLLTIFIRIRIQHKPIIIHALAVIFIGLLALLAHPHFIESIASGAIKII